MKLFADYKNMQKERVVYFSWLVSSWIAGISAGFYLYKPSLLSWMCRAISQPVSIVGLLVVVFLPLIFSYFSFISDKPILFLIVLFFKAIAFGFSGAFITQIYSSAAWLVCILFLFSDYASTVVLFVLGLCYTLNPCKTRSVGFYLSGLACLLIAITDYFVISPFIEGFV